MSSLMSVIPLLLILESPCFYFCYRQRRMAKLASSGGDSGPPNTQYSTDPSYTGSYEAPPLATAAGAVQA